MRSVSLTGVERTFHDDEIIVSKTDTKGRITYANRVFLRVAQFQEHEILGKPHSIIRHPHMPRGVFKVLWDTIATGKEIFAYVLNRASSGDHYWVFAHVTPTFDAAGSIVSYHSNRRSPNRLAVDAVKPVYEHVLRIESRFENPKDQVAAGTTAILEFLAKHNTSYDQFIFSLAA